jgi:hypothetical protein
MRAAYSIGLAQAALFFPLAMWRWIYPDSDWAVFSLIIVFLMLYRGAFVPAAATYRARLGIELRSGSVLSRYLTGRLHASIGALAFSVLATPVLAWQALTASPVEAIGFLALGIVSGTFVLALHAKLGQHFTQWVARSASIAIGALIAAILFVPVLAWINWSYVPHPAGILSDSLPDAVLNSIDDLPQRRGWIAELLTLFYAFDGAKLWVTVRFGSSGWITGLYSLDAALIGFILARSSAILTSLISDDIINSCAKEEK